jgi:hypothetical protein
MTYIKVPYYDQLNMDDGQGWRDCFSATSAMIAAHYGKVHGENEYNHLRQRYGDSTNPQAQLQALRHLGLDAHYATDGTQKSLCGLLDGGKPVGIGVLHHGPFTAPTPYRWRTLDPSCPPPREAGERRVHPFPAAHPATGGWHHLLVSWLAT